MNALKKDCFTPPVPKKPTIAIGKVLPINLAGAIFPNEYSDFRDEESGNWHPNAQEYLSATVKVLNAKYSFFKSITINVDYNCGRPNGMTGNECNKRGERLYNNTIKRLYEFGLKMPKNMIIRGRINAFQEMYGDEKKGVHIEIIPK